MKLAGDDAHHGGIGAEIDVAAQPVSAEAVGHQGSLADSVLGVEVENGLHRAVFGEYVNMGISAAAMLPFWATAAGDRKK